MFDIRKYLAQLFFRIQEFIVVVYVSILCVIYVCLVFIVIFNTCISNSKIQVPLFLATCFVIKYHLQAISNVCQHLGSKITKKIPI
jgi:hypothetical protein